MATTNKNLALPANGSSVNSWDVPMNSNFTVIDTALGGITNLNVTSVSGNVSLTGNQSIPPNIVIAGNLSGNVAYQFPSNTGGFWSVTNNSVGVGNITFGVTGGGNVTTVLQNYATPIKSDGTNVLPFDNSPNKAAGNTTQIQFNSGGILAGSAALTFSGTTLGTSVLQLNGNSTGYVGFQAPATATPTIWTLPSADGTNGQVLTTNGNTSLSWTTVASGGGAVTSFNTRTGAVTLASSDVTSALGFTPASLASPAFTGSPTAPTQTTADNTTKIATDAYVQNNLANYTSTSGLSTYLASYAPSGTNANALGYMGIPQTVRSSGHTSVLTDVGEEQFYTTSATQTIAANSSVAMQIGSFMVFSADVGVTLTVGITSDTLLWPVGNVTGTRTVTGPGFMIVNKKKSTTWWVTGGVGIS